MPDSVLLCGNHDDLLGQVEDAILLQIGASIPRDSVFNPGAETLPTHRINRNFKLLLCGQSWAESNSEPRIRFINKVMNQG